ncbi:MAG: acetolactate synthase [Ignavibacteria bacterium GWA2_35_9]|nr:MAG: acetolactate synthase [Ignavibacteria bacterium GWA2_35_9]OGU43946.1 MAG: acetolactate synthase [Ignavibacteria bacterium GWB2_36_8]OGU53755.1 MAG: acetolactate synthase [Ignavibacteria bacterium GWC2_36_12]
MKVSDYIAEFLESQRITCVFELAGGMITHLLDSLHRKGKIKIVSMHHEQGAAFAADAFGRITGLPGIALATSGPGATNLLTGIASCYFDSSPAIFITGQVNTHEQKGNKDIRQLGFQETDIVKMALPITKKTFSVKTSEDVPRIFEEAFQVAISGRPGPVLIDLPMNLQRGEVNIFNFDKIKKHANNTIDNIAKKDLDQIIEKLIQAKRPLILAGRGIRSGFVLDEFIKFVEKINIPVVSSLLAVDVLPFNHPLRVGFIGSYGNRWANIALGTCDCLLVLGSRLDIRQTGADVDSFSKDKTIIHIDIEKTEINNRVKTKIGINTDLNVFLKQINNAIARIQFPLKKEWLNTITELRSAWPDIKELNNIEGINPNVFVHKLSEKANRVKYFIADVGNHQMWAAQSLELSKEQLFITSGGMGAMGFGLPAAIGAAIASNNSSTVVIAGDGGFQVNIQELQTIVSNKLPIKIIVLNNNCLGMIRQFQDSYFDSRYQSTYWGYGSPDFEKVGKAYGIDSKTISGENEFDEALKWFFDDDDETKLLQVMIDVHTNAYPKLAFGKPIAEMEPFSKPLDIEGT